MYNFDYTLYIKLLIALVIIGIVAAGAWNLRDGSLDALSVFSTNKYGSFLSQINAKNLPFKVLTPSYISPGFKFLEEDSAKIVQGNIGIPQVNYMFETSDGNNGLVLRQMDKARYQKEIFGKQGINDFKTLFETQFRAAAIERDGKTIYTRIPTEKVRSILGDLQYIASAHLVNDDSVIELNYSGTVPFSEEELIKILVSLK